MVGFVLGVDILNHLKGSAVSLGIYSLLVTLGPNGLLVVFTRFYCNIIFQRIACINQVASGISGFLKIQGCLHIARLALSKHLRCRWSGAGIER